MMLESIKDIIARIRGEEDRDEQTRPLGIKDDELEVLKRFHESAQWKVLLRLVDRAARLENESFLNAEGDPAYTRGYINGVRAVPKVIEYVLNQEEYQDERRRQRERRNERERQRARDLSTFGHPARQSTD